ncbi:uncharacterized protein LOC133853833 [Alnus glutinosa]|uniref:uncharacterized protein LOC133853833 n=1 Tax=Alnus glutinosa TaxID=3517 RepID=UPI002D78BEFB|nr:uncharacterized protein LOC133853833 [Alnus glutinosa]
MDVLDARIVANRVGNRRRRVLEAMDVPRSFGGHCHKEVQESLVAQSSSSKSDQFTWKSLWALTVPNAVKTFSWKACYEALPNKENLRKKKVLEDTSCPFCLREKETLIHAIWDCPAAQDMWGCNLSPFQKCSWEVFSFRELFERSIYSFDKDKVELLVYVARAIWFRRNKTLFEGFFTHLDEVFYGALKALAEYKDCQQMEFPHNSSASNLNQNAHRAVWCLPPSGFIKINWDAAKIKADAHLAETIAALGEVKFSTEAGFFDAICEWDATKVVADINSEPPYLSNTSHFIENIHMEKLRLRSCLFVFAPREANLAAHTLAKEAICNKNYMCWLEDVPSNISSIVFREASVSLDP